MKKTRDLILFLGVIFTIGMLCACGKDSVSGKKGTATGGAADAGIPDTTGVVSDSVAADTAEKILAEMSLDEKIGQLFIVNLETLDPAKKDKNTYTKITETMKRSLYEYPVGGVILYSDNMESVDQTKKLTKDLQAYSKYTPLYIAVEEGYGNNSLFAQNEKLEGTAFGTYEEIGAQKTREEVYEMGKTTGKQLSQMGINLNLGITADIADSDGNMEYTQNCFSDDADIVSDMLEGIIKGMQTGGVGAGLKTFPGVGSIAGDLDKEIVDDDNALSHMRSVDFVPFATGISADTDVVRVGSVSISKITQNKVPASMSELIVGGVLREELEFKGVIMTDSYNTQVITSQYSSEQAALQAIVAGVDMILEPEELQAAFRGIKAAVGDNSLSERVINEAVLHILQNKVERGIIELDSNNEVITPAAISTTPKPTAKPKSKKSSKKNKNKKNSTKKTTSN